MIDQEFDLPRVGVGAVILSPDDRVLLIKRNAPPALGRWSIPGGKLEAEETLTNACLREVREETGLAVKLGPVVAIVERIEDCFHYVIVDFLATTEQKGSLVPRAAGDVSDARWVELERLSEYDLAEGLSEIIRISKMLRCHPMKGGLRETSRNRSDFVADPCPGD